MYDFKAIPGAKYRTDYEHSAARLNELVKTSEAKFLEAMRYGCLNDLFFLLYFGLDRVDLNHPWIVARCYEVQDLNDRTVDLWPRGHGKTSIITGGLIIQDILKNPEHRIGIFSFKRAISQSFLRQIMKVFERNTILQKAFPDVLYEKPDSQAPKWSEDAGIIVKRNGSYIESTIEAWGLVDNLPTSRHFTIRHYDDIINENSVSTPDQMQKAEDAFGMSKFLSHRPCIERVVGTIYDFGDVNHKLKNNANWNTRCHSARDDNGELVLLTEDEWTRLTDGLSEWQIACQMYLNPIMFSEKKLDPAWIKYHKNIVNSAVNRYIVVDPARTKGKKSDYTVMWVIDLDDKKNYIIRDCVRDKLSLSERWVKLKNLIKNWNGVIRVGYAKTAAESDLEYFDEKMREEGIFFQLVPLKETKDKIRVIEKLQPLFKDGRFWFPEQLWYDNVRGERHNLVEEFLREEYMAFPSPVHDDMLNALAFIRHEDMLASFVYGGTPVQHKEFSPLDLFQEEKSSHWMGV